MELTVETKGDVAVVSIHCEHLDASISDEFKNDMTPLIEANHKIVLDMKELRFVDSAGLGAVLSCLRRLGDVNGDLKLCNLTIAGLEALFEIARKAPESCRHRRFRR